MDNTGHNYLQTLEQIGQHNLIFRAVINSLKKRNKENFLSCILRSVPEICLLLVLNHLCKNSDIVTDFLKSTASTLYKKFFFKSYKVVDADKNITRTMKNIIYQRYYNQESLFPTSYVTVINEEDYINTSIFSTKRKTFLEAVKIAIDKTAKRNKKPTCYVADESFTYKTYTPTTLYPSKNYSSLASTLDDYIEYSKYIKDFRVKGILLDGEPGLGKSLSVDYYVSNTTQCKSVYRVDLSLMPDQDIKSILDMFIKPPIGATVIMLDELDKYVKFNIDINYTKHRKEYFASQTENNNHTMELQDKEQFVIDQKTSMLLEILKILEKSGNYSPCCILFCSNNFHTIFEGVDMVHFTALTTRFIVHPFKRCDKEDFIGYCNFYNNLCKDTKFYCEDLESILELTPNDLSLTWRELDALRFLHGCDYYKIIKSLKDNVLLQLVTSDIDDIGKVAQKETSIPEEYKLVDEEVDKPITKKVDKPITKKVSKPITKELDKPITKKVDKPIVNPADARITKKANTLITKKEKTPITEEDLDDGVDNGHYISTLPSYDKVHNMEGSIVDEEVVINKLKDMVTAINKDKSLTRDEYLISIGKMFDYMTQDSIIDIFTSDLFADFRPILLAKINEFEQPLFEEYYLDPKIKETKRLKINKLKNYVLS